MDNQIDEVKYQIFETNQTEVNENVLPFEYKNGIDEAFNTDEKLTISVLMLNF